MTAANSGAAATVLGALLEARTGQAIAASRAWRVDTAIGPLLAELGIADADALVGRVLGGTDPLLVDRVVDALLNQETSFFRDAGVLEGAVQALGIVTAGSPVAPRIWCAACATGQEPLSLAMLFAEAGGNMPEIVATDVSNGAIARARLGRYSHFEIQRGLPVRRMLRWFAPDGGERNWTAAPELLRTVTWHRHNLVADPPPGRRFDLVACRNLLFYLGEAARERAMAHLAAAVRPGGLLLLGAGETVIGRSTAFRPSLAHRGLYERVEDGSGSVAA